MLPGFDEMCDKYFARITGMCITSSQQDNAKKWPSVAKIKKSIPETSSANETTSQSWQEEYISESKQACHHEHFKSSVLAES